MKKFHVSQFLMEIYGGKQPQEQSQAQPHLKAYECIKINQLNPIIDIDKNIEDISTIIY